MIRLYEQGLLTVGQMIALSEHANHHLLTVLRAKVQDEVILFNGNGHEYKAMITQIAKKQIHVLIQSVEEKNIESPLHIHLAQSIPRSDKMEYIVQKAAQLGVTSITPIIAERSQGRLSKEQEQKKAARLQAIVIAACEQCGRNRLPAVQMPISLTDWLNQTDSNETVRYILLPPTDDTEVLPQEELTQPKSVSLLIGPEGGFTAQEVALSKQHGFSQLTLGRRILRTETASIAAISIMQWRYGDFR